nr:porin [Nevskia sp.]
MQYDAVRFDDGRTNDLTRFDSQDGSYFRRGYVTFNAKWGQWGARFENDFAIGVELKAVREFWISHKLAGGEILIGQHKPFRGLEELSSSNELSLLERPAFATAAFGGNIARQFQPGLFWRRPLSKTLLLQLSAYNAHQGLGQPVGRGVGTANRLSWIPVNTQQQLVYVGGSIGYDYFTDGNPGVRSVNYAGRSSAGGNVIGPSQRIVEIGEDAGQFFAGFEGAVGIGPLHLQTEVVLIDNEDARGAGRDDQVLSYYGQASYFLTGERKEYQSGKARFGAPHAFRHGWGAVELTARYDSIENLDRRAAAGSGTCLADAAVAIVGAECETHAYTVGANYYVTPLVRVLFNLVNGYNEVTDDHTQSYNVRLQIAF